MTDGRNVGIELGVCDGIGLGKTDGMELGKEDGIVEGIKVGTADGIMEEKELGREITHSIWYNREESTRASPPPESSYTPCHRL